MSFTVVIKNNDDGRIVFASEKTNALVFGAVADKESTDTPVASFAMFDATPADITLTIALARRAIESFEEREPTIKMMRPIADAFVASRGHQTIKEEDSEND